MILGIIGGLYGLSIGLFGYGLGALAGAGGAAHAGFFQFISLAIPIASIVGGAIVKAKPMVGAGLMLLSAAGMFFFVWVQLLHSDTISSECDRKFAGIRCR
jgi:hypothetical protein